MSKQKIKVRTEEENDKFWEENIKKGQQEREDIKSGKMEKVDCSVCKGTGKGKFIGGKQQYENCDNCYYGQLFIHHNN